ncbi:unnamed protein product [Musa textilis]
MHNNVRYLPKQASAYPKLSMLMLQKNYHLEGIPRTLFQCMAVLTSLDLSHTQITELPSEIGMLSELQQLNLTFTPIKSLPVELGCLVKLKYLLLRTTYKLETMPKGTISNLSLLRLLDLQGSQYADWYEHESLKGCKKSVGISIKTAAALQRLSSLPHVYTWHLQLQEMEDLAFSDQLFKSIAGSRNIRQSLELLSISSSSRMDELSVVHCGEAHEEGLECLKYLKLKDLQPSREVTWKGVKPEIMLPSLRELVIYNCNKLRNVTWVPQLPCLYIMDRSRCNDMEALISDAGASISFSLSLSRLRLDSLHKLNCISRQPVTFPYLESIEVINCRQPKKLPFGAEIYQNKLKEIRGWKGWWDMIEWEEVSIKDSLSSYFKDRIGE